MVLWLPNIVIIVLWLNLLDYIDDILYRHEKSTTHEDCAYNDILTY